METSAGDLSHWVEVSRDSALAEAVVPPASNGAVRTERNGEVTACGDRAHGSEVCWSGALVAVVPSPASHGTVWAHDERLGIARRDSGHRPEFAGDEALTSDVSAPATNVLCPGRGPAAKLECDCYRRAGPCQMCSHMDTPFYACIRWTWRATCGRFRKNRIPMIAVDRDGIHRDATSRPGLAGYCWRAHDHESNTTKPWPTPRLGEVTRQRETEITEF